MDAETIRRRKQELGEWTAHNIELADGVFTRGPQLYGDEYRVRRVVQIVADLAGRPFEELRVLDLACLEGLYSIELGKRGSEVVGIEGRAAGVAKADFAKEALGLERVSFVQDDVRNLSRERYGEFDVVLCVGILYHLDAPDVFEFLARIGEVCTRLTIVDTHVALTGRSSREHDGRLYRGLTYVEHSASTPEEARERASWASLDNPTSFWLTGPSLVNALGRAGFTTVLDCKLPPLPNEQRDRVSLVAVKGKPEGLAATPLLRAGESLEASEGRGKRILLPQLPGAPRLTRLALDVKRRVNR